MALRTSTMNMPYSDQSPKPEQERYNLPRKLVILLLLVVASSLWLYILFHEGRIGYGRTIQKIAAGVVIAIVAGLGAQLILSQRDGLFRFVAAMAADVAGVYLLGFISDGSYGISKFGWLPRSIDYDGLNLIGIGLGILLLISLLFRRTKVIVIAEPIQVSPPAGESGNASFVQAEPANSILISDSSRPRISWSRIFMPGSMGRERSNGRRAGRIRPLKAAPVIAPKRRGRSRKARVQLALVEEHRCPYCLETVTRTDPHVECTVCHTLHHRDCWEITGTCQVPHLNN